MLFLLAFLYRYVTNSPANQKLFSLYVSQNVFLIASVIENNHPTQWWIMTFDFLLAKSYSYYRFGFL